MGKNLKDNVLSILISISKTLWTDTIMVFKQFKQHYFTQAVKQNAQK